MVSLLSSKAHTVSNLTAARRNRLRRALLETLEQRCLMAADLGLLDSQQLSELRAESQTRDASNGPLRFIQTNINEAALTDAASFLGNTLGSSSGGLTSQPWFPLVNRAYDQWSQQNGLAFSFSTSQPNIFSGLAAEGEGLVAEGEAGGPRLLSVAPNSGEIFSFNHSNTLTEAPTELVFRFDRAIDPSTIQKGITITRSGRDGGFADDNNPEVKGTALMGDSPLIVTLRFPTTLPDDTYHIAVSGSNNAIRDTSGKTLEPRAGATGSDQIEFKLELGAQVIAVVPQPVDHNPDGTLAPQLDTIRVYFNDDDLDLATATDPNFYQLIYTADSVRPNDDQRFTPASVTYDAALDMATLKFASGNTPLRIDQLAGAGTYRLRVGSNVVVNSVSNPPAIPAPNMSPEPSGYFSSAQPLDSYLTNGSVRITESLINTGNPLPLDLIGSDLDPGSRDISPKIAGSADNHINDTLSGDSSKFIDKKTFSFSLNVSYGYDSQARPVYTSITPDQMTRIREAFEFYSQQLGIDFVEVETPNPDLTVVVGDMYPAGMTSGKGGVLGVQRGSLIVLDGAEDWDSTFGGDFFTTALHEIGHNLGLGHDYDLPAGTVMQGYSGPASGAQQFPGNDDVIHGQYIYRPDNKDVDLYKFTVGAGQTKNLRVETIAERLADSSDADTVLTLYKQTESGRLVVLASNNDYFSSDSFLTLDVEGGATGTTYFVAVTSSGNQDFDPSVADSGSGGISQGKYQLLVDLVDKTNVSIVDKSGSALDGDGDGIAGGDFNFWFRTAAPAGTPGNTGPRMVFVDKAYNLAAASDGSPSRPFKSLPTAVANVTSGDILRIVGNLGADGLLSTQADAKAYEIGRGGPGNAVLSDGLTFQVPQGVTAMIDAGAVFKLRGSRITAGSLDTGGNNSFSSIQVLGTRSQPVYFTSYDDQSTGVDTNPISTAPQAGNWGGIEIHNDVDRAQGRGDYERKGIFLNYIAHANIRYGGGQVTVLNPSPTLNPIYLAESRPTLLYNTITASADAALSADADSFEETLFTEPRYQLPTSSTDKGYRPDYDRVGPDIRGNMLDKNSVNGLFIRVPTAPGQELTSLNVAARFDDTDITYVLGENLIIGGTPGGAVRETTPPTVSLVQGTSGSGGSLAAGIYQYKVTFVDRFGAESVPSAAVSLQTSFGNSYLQLSNLPAATGTFVGRRIWRRGAADNSYVLVAELDRTSTSYRDTGGSLGVTGGDLNSTSLQRARRDARLAIDPGVVIKSLGSRIEVGMGAQLIAEGTADRPIIFTSKLDDRYGAGGTLDTNNDAAATVAQARDWGGLVARHLSSLSVDHAVIAYGGGVTSVPGGFAAFNPIEIHQAQGRVAHSILEQNGNGFEGGNLQLNRGGRGHNAAATIYVDSSQPVIIDNVLRNNLGAAINIDIDSMKSVSVRDWGRQTGAIDARPGGLGNFGPLVRGNQLSGKSTGGQEVINGMEIRGGTLTTETVWDDTDIVHVLRTEVVVPNFHHVGGLRLVSRVDESLVVKLQGATAGFTAGGQGSDVTDRIGGTVQIEGAPGFPVVLTSLKDDTVGAGFDPTGTAQTDTNGNGTTSSNGPQPADWRSIKFLPLSNDRNVATVPELESDQIQDRGTNDETQVAQPIGGLATGLGYGDENLRLGFVVNGTVASLTDQDVYSFVGSAGAQVWLDIDRTGASLDSVVELINEAGVVIAKSDNSLFESAGTSSTLYQSNNPALIAPNQVQVLDRDPFAVANHWLPGIARDFGSANPLDAGMRVQLPGTEGTTNTYYVRVRSNATTGTYRLQVRLQQTDEVAGSSVHYADVRYATNGVEAQATPIHSPLVGDNAVEQGTTPVFLGDLGASDRGAFSVGGTLQNGGDVKLYDITINRNYIQQIPGQSVNPVVSTIFDVDYADGFGGPNTNIWVFNKSDGRLVYMGTDSNIADDRSAPGQGSDVDDLSRGSTGSLDAFIGAQALPTGNYIVAVSANSRLSAAMDQFQRADSANPLTRVEPIDSVRRVIEDHFDTSNPKRPSTASSNNLPVAFQSTQDSLRTDNLVPYTLADIATYVISNTGSATQLKNINAFTGAYEGLVSNSGLNISGLAMSPSGLLIGFNQSGVQNDAGSGRFYGLTKDSNSAASPLGSGLLAVQTFTTVQTNANAPAGTPPTYGLAQRNNVGDGIVFHGLTYGYGEGDGANLALTGVGSRGNGVKSFMEPGIDPATGGISRDANGNINAIAENYNTTNIVYAIDPASFQIIDPDTGSPRAGDNRAFGAGTSRLEMGRFLSGTFGNQYTDGVVTGLAQIGSILYAVSNKGELFRANVGADGRNSFPATTSGPGYSGVLPFKKLAEGSTALNFTGLTKGTLNLKDSSGGSLKDILFATTSDGTIYAFDTSGNFQNIFPGATYKTHSAARSVGGSVAGIAFSPLDVNLWHITNTRNGDDGHGYPQTFDQSRPDAEKGSHMLRFGFENAGAAIDDNQQDGTWPSRFSVYNNKYNLPGGAKGAVESKSIDLRGYSADDLPTLYFNYFLSTDDTDADGATDSTFMRDSFRVYGTTDGTTWTLLATNNSADDLNYNNGKDEFDNGGSNNRDAFGKPLMVQELFDRDQWRQARVNLAAFAGQQNLRLRFEFASGGSFNSADPLTGGVELTAVPGWKLKDGDTFTVATEDFVDFASQRFEFDLGLVLNLPGGSSIPNGSTLHIAGNTYTFGTSATNDFVISSSDTPAQVATKVAAKLSSLGAYVNAIRPNVVILPTDSVKVPAGGTYFTTGISSIDVIQGRPGVNGTNAPVPVRADKADYDTAAKDVRDAMRTALAKEFSNNQLNVWTVYGNTIRLLKYTVTDSVGVLGVSTERYGDKFGIDYLQNDGKKNDPAFDAAALRDAGNANEGVYIDDIIIGFAERGEQVINSQTGIANASNFITNRGFEPNGFGIPETVDGRFQLEIRTAYDYGIIDDNGGRHLRLDVAHDTNDRGTSSIALRVPEAAKIKDGTTFTLADDTSLATFEFDVTNGPTDIRRGTQPGNIPVAVSANATAGEVAAAVRSAINSSAARTLLSLSASVQGEMIQGSTDRARDGSAVVVLHGSASLTRTANSLPANSPLQLLSYGADQQHHEDAGDRNRTGQDQGQLLISSSSFSYASQWGVKLDDTGNPASPRNFPTQNQLHLAPGAVVINNIFNSNASGGVTVVGDTLRAVPTAPVARIMNNTFYGRKSTDTGVNVVNGATPTVLNNIFANLGTSISVGANNSTVVGANVFQGNSRDPLLGSFPMVLGAAAPLFVSPSARNFYLAAGSQAIDSSLEALPERQELSLLRNSIALPPSPMLSPDRDIFGQRRVDDPTANPPAGFGSNVFKDRGATDRSDFAALQAIIMQPQDNDSSNVDIDRNISFVRLDDGLLDYFSILLQDGEGIGPDAATVVPEAITLTENGRLLQPGVDYVFGYNANSHTVRLTPRAGIWRSDSVYEISLNNRDGRRITLGTGASATEGDTITVTLPDTTPDPTDNPKQVFKLSKSAVGTSDIPFSDNDTPYQIAVRVVDRINSMGGGISAFLQGSGAVMVIGAADVQSSDPDSASVVKVGAVRDLAGNALAPNRANGQTQFTIVMPDVQLDYGDAPGNGSVTMQASDGARHALLPVDVSKLTLGQLADADADGLPSDSATGDDNDGNQARVDLGTLGSIGGVVLGPSGPATYIAPAGSTANLDGVTLKIADPLLKTVIFEFTTDAAVTPGNLKVTVNTGDSAAVVAIKLADAIRAALLTGKITGVAPVASGTEVSLGGTALHKFEVSKPTILQRLAVGNVELSIPATAPTTIVDGQTFTIHDGNGQSLTFEIDDVSLSPTTQVQDPHVAIRIDLPAATASSIAQAISTAINEQIAARRIGLAPSVASGTSVSVLADDEDGVTFGGLFNGKSLPVPVTVYATGTGMLDAWFDWNADGDFNDAGEHKVISKPVSSGPNVFSIDTPTTAEVGFTTARFRLSTFGDQLPSGLAIGGEVEDHLIEIVAGTPPVAVNDSYEVNEDDILTVGGSNGVLTNDTDAEDVNLTVLDLDPATPDVQTTATTANGTLVLHSDGSFTYTPNADFFGEDSFVYQAMDQRLSSKELATVVINVKAVNDRPLANDDIITISEDEEVVLASSVFLDNDWKHYLNVANENVQSLELIDAAMVSPIRGTVSLSGNELTFTPAANYNNAIDGPVLVLLTIRDGKVAGSVGDGAGAENNPLPSTSTLTINITPVNDRPEFTMPPTTSTQEDALGLVSTPFITDIRPGPVEASDEASTQTVSFNVQALDESLFTVQPAIAADGTLTYKLAPDVNEIVAGANNPGFPEILVQVTAVDSDGVSSLPVTFTVLPDAINDAPEFHFKDQDPSAPVMVDEVVTVTEDAGLVTVPDFLIFSPGPATALDEGNQTIQNISIQLLNPPASPASPFSVFPTIDRVTKTLTFQSAPDVNSNFVTGDFVFSVTVTDSGTGPGVNSSTNTFTISITPVNDEPFFTLPSSSTAVDEDNEAQTGEDKTQIVDFATGIGVAPATALDELATQQPEFIIVSVSEPSLFRVQPQLTPTGVLEFATQNDKNGQAVVVVQLTDHGASTAPDDNITAEQTFTINVRAVNDPPEITVPSSTPASLEDSGLVTVPNFATRMRPGPDTATDEDSQPFTVHVTANDLSAFSSQPEIGANGTLYYQAAPDVNSSFRDLSVVVYLTDRSTDGSLPDPAQSVSHTFTIRITPVNDAPDFSLPQEKTITVLEDDEATKVPPVSQTDFPGFIPLASISRGPATAGDEVNQGLAFEILDVSAPELFSTQPTISSDGTLSFKTAANKNGKAVVIAHLRDDNNTVDPDDDRYSAAKTFTIAVTPVNDAPLFVVPAGLTVDEDAGVITRGLFATGVGRGPAGADDESSQTIKFVVEAVNPGAFETQPEIAADGTLTFKTKANVNSNNSDLRVRVYLTDSGAFLPPDSNTSATQTFSITVNPVNDPPVADALSLNSIEDVQIEIQASTVLAGDSAGPTADESTQMLTITQVERTTKLGGTVTPVFNGSVITSMVYRPAVNAVGVDTFLYVVSDDGVPARSGTGTIAIVLDPLNDPPQFTMGVDQTVIEDSATVTVPNWAADILAGPPSAIDEPLTQTVNFVVTANNPALFEVQPTVSGDGTLSFKPAKDVVGTAVVSVFAQDTGSNTAPNINHSATSSFTITITPVNDAPVFTAGAAVVVDEDSGQYSGPWATGIAAAGGLLSQPPTAGDESAQVVDFVVTPNKPQLFSVAPRIDANGVLTFTPAQNAFGVVLVSVVAKDRGPAGANDQNSSAPQTLTITINAQNDAPNGAPDTLTADENGVLTVAAPGLLANDSDVDLPADAISAVPASLTSALGAAVTINADGSVSYDPRSVDSLQRLSSGQSEADSFTYQVRDLAGATSGQVTVTVIVQGIDDAPVANPDSFTVPVGQAINLDILANDTDADSQIDFRTIVLTAMPAFGTATVNQTGVVNYAPGVGFRGTDTFSYVVRDVTGNLSNEAKVTLTVNNAPRAANDNAFTVKNRSVVIDVAGNDTDPDGTIDPSTVEIAVQPSPGGVAIVRADGKIEYTPATDFVGSVRLSYFVRDNVGSPSNVADVSVEVLRSAWQNPTLRLDVNGDGHISPIDALLIINYLNSGAPSELPSNQAPPPYLDPNGDEHASPHDVLLIINYLNSNPSGEGEGAGTADVEMGAPLIVTMVTPEQMVAAVGGQIVSDVEAALAAELQRCEGWHSEDSSNLVTDLASDVWSEEDSAAALADLSQNRSRLRGTEEVDSFFETL